MARGGGNDNTVLVLGLVGIGGYLLYEWAKTVCRVGETPLQCIGDAISQWWGANAPVSLTPGPNPGLMPFGAGGTQGGGTLPPTTGTPPQIVGAGTGGVPVCVDNATGQHFPPNADGTCPIGSTLTLAIDVTASAGA